MPLFVALIATAFFGERLSTARKLGPGLILGGSVMLVGWRAAGWSAARSLGDALFLGASLLTAGFTVPMSRAKLDPLHAAALVSTGLLALYGPLYLAFCGARLARLPAADFAVHAVFQGLLVTIISVVLDARAIVILGASAGAAFGALVPVLSALFAIPLLGEWPSGADWAGIVVISAGVFLATGGARGPPGMIVPAAISACGKDG